MKNKIILSIISASFFCGVYGQSTTAKLDEAIMSYVNQGKFAGTVLVARQGKIILQKGYGMMNAENKTVNSVNTIYQVASLAKQFTSAVILKLQEQGKLSVQDKLSIYYSGYPNGDKITIHHLLSHTSGVYNYTDNKEFMAGDQSKPVTLDYMLKLFIEKPLVFEPGTKFSYSNSGYTLLGFIIEKVTSKPYREVLYEMIIRPLELSNTGYDYDSLVNSNKSTGYKNHATGIYDPATYINPSILYTTGALYSTVGDLFKWHQTLMGTSFLSARSIQMLYTPVAGTYGYGWSVDSLFGKKRVSHSGNVAGFKSNINRIPEDDVCVIALSNSNSSQVGTMVMTLLSVIYDKPYQLPVERKALKLDTGILKQYIGTYQFSPQFSIVVSLENERLNVQATNQPKFEILAENETYFFLKDFDMQFEFKKIGGTGIFDAMIFYRNKQPMHGQRITQ